MQARTDTNCYIFYFSDLTFTSLPGNFVLLQTQDTFYPLANTIPPTAPFRHLSHVILPHFQTALKIYLHKYLKWFQIPSSYPPPSPSLCTCGIEIWHYKNDHYYHYIQCVEVQNDVWSRDCVVQIEVMSRKMDKTRYQCRSPRLYFKINYHFHKKRVFYMFFEKQLRFTESFFQN